MADTPLYTFLSSTGRWFVSTEKPPATFSIQGEIDEVGDFNVLDEHQPIPCTNWNVDNPAVLFRSKSRNAQGLFDYRIGRPDHEAPDGFERIGSDFAFVIDDWNFRRAMALDRGLPFDEKPY